MHDQTRPPPPLLPLVMTRSSVCLVRLLCSVHTEYVLLLMVDKGPLTKKSKTVILTFMNELKINTFIGNILLFNINTMIQVRVTIIIVLVSLKHNNHKWVTLLMYTSGGTVGICVSKY